MIVTPDHIKSHQDSDTDYSTHSWKAKLNCDCSHLACSTWQCPECCPMHTVPYLLPPDNIASIQINGKFITSHIATAIREASFHPELIQYITNKSAWQCTTIIDTIDWEARSRASLSLPQGNRLTIFKLEFDLFATMSQHHKMEKHMDHRCPRCCKLHENLNHVFQCSQAASTRKSAWAQFLSTLQKTSTCPLIVETLGYGISHWSTGSLPQWQGPNPGPTDNFRLLMLSAFQEQQSIGWDQAIRGCLSVHWEKANTLYCQEQLHQGNVTTCSMWSSNLVQVMWQFGTDQWVVQNKILCGKTKKISMQRKPKSWMATLWPCNRQIIRK